METYRILAVEDTEFNREFLKLSLKRGNYDLVVVENGAECLQILKVDSDFNVILMDIETPVISGIDACRIIKKRFPVGVRGIPIVAVTAHSRPEYLSELQNKGFSGYLVKPYKKDDLIKAIESFSVESLPVKRKERTDSSSFYDLSSIEEWASGDEGMVRELVSVFVKDAPVKLENLKKAHCENHWADVQSIAHGFGPQLFFVGLSESYDETSKIEKLAMGKIGAEQIDELLKHVELACMNAISALKKDFQL